MKNNMLKRTAELTLPVCIIKTKYPELEQMIRVILGGRVSFITEGTADLIIEDEDFGISVFSTCRNDHVFIERPFSEDTLIGSIEALADDQIFLGFTADEKNLLAVLGDVSVKLTPTEFRLFSTILKNGREFISANALSEAVWGRCDRNLCTVYISYLRRKLDLTFGDGTLITSRGKGYRLRDRLEN